LFDVSFDVDLYPARFIVDESIAEEMGRPGTTPILANDEGEFLDILTRILGSRETRKVIQAIYSQSLELGKENGDSSDYLEAADH
jgi:hypothetical protein